MLPKSPPPRMRGFGLYVPSEVLAKADVIAKAEKVKSRNSLLGSFLAFAVELWPLLKPLNAQVEAFAEGEGCSYPEAIARLVERGLRSRK